MRGVLIAALLLAMPALAHHPGERLDEVTASKEPTFEVTDNWQLPALNVLNAAGDSARLNTMSDQVVVLSFVIGACGVPCDTQQEQIDRVREAVDITPMRDMVTFLRVVEPGAKVADGGSAPVFPAEGTTVAELASSFGDLSVRGTREPLVHVIDRRGRHAGLFHGDTFDHINMMHYINGLTNARPPERGLLETVSSFFQ